MPITTSLISGTQAHKHEAAGATGGYLAEGLTGFTGGNVGEVLTATATDIPEWAAIADTHNSGMITMYGGTNASIPSGWLLCDGSSVATATYPDLFTALGYSYGGAGANFNLPDMVGVFTKGSATQTATTGGSNSLTLTESQMPTHNHSINDSGHVHDIGGAYTTAISFL